MSSNSNAENGAWLALEVIGYIVPALCIPLAIYHNIQLYSHRNEMFLRKRSTSLTVLFCLNICIILTMFVIALTELTTFHSSDHSVVHLISFNLYLVSWWFILYFLLLKSWLLYYKYHWTYHTLQSEWQLLINSKSTKQTNFFVKNHTTYGNTCHMAKVFGALCGIGVIVCLTGELKSAMDSNYPIVDISLICLSISMAPVIVFYVIIVFKTPFIEDPFYIHWESKWQARILFIMCIAFLVMEIFNVFVHYYKALLIADPILELLLFALHYLSTAYIMSKNAEHETKDSNKAKQSSPSSVKLVEILSNKDALHQFMLHLSKEYSMECVLSISLIEFQQYQEYVKKLDGNIEGNVNIISLDSSVPISEIIECEEMMDGDYDGDASVYAAKRKAHKIYSKYIKEDSVFEINIAYGERKKLHQMLANDDELIKYEAVTLSDLYVLFESCKKEMMSLLELSLYRFRFRPEYVALEIHLNKESKEK
eukprot:408028_1